MARLSKLAIDTNTAIKMPSIVRSTLCILLLTLMGVCSAAQNESIEIKDLRTVVVNDQIKVNCEVSYSLEDSLKAALSNGIEMSFRLEIELRQKTPYWLDITQAKLEREFTVKYHALSKQYVMQDAGSDVERSFPDLYSAFYYQRRLHNAVLANSEVLQAQQQYYMRARARLISEQLALPLRIKSYFSAAWRPNSGWTEWPM